MKITLFFFSLCLGVTIANAQTTVTGSVKDPKGNPLHYVFIGNNNEDKVATFSDSLGNFSIKVINAKGLHFDLKGYKDTSVNIDKNNPSLTVTLQPGSGNVSQSQVSALPIQETNNPAVQATFGSGGSIMPSHQQGELHGNRYMFNTFLHGYVINPAGALVHSPDYLFDYDKISGELLLTTGDKNVTSVPMTTIKTFTLFDNTDKALTFAKVTAVSPNLYVQVLSAGKKYGIYKLTTTKFVKADFVNTGMSTRGNDYDSYEDTFDYYVVDMQSGAAKKISLRKKALKDAFASDADKVNKYLSANSGDIDDDYLAAFGDAMNQ